MKPSGDMAEVVGIERTSKDEGDGPVHGVDLQVDLGGGDIETVELFQPPGDDSLPMKGDAVLLHEAPGSGSKAAIGSNDPNNAGTAEEGERRGYSRQSDGSIAAEFWLKANGDVVIKSYVATGRIVLESAGPVIVKSPDIRVGDETASRAIACVGDIVAGSIKAIVAAPSPQPLLPATGAPTASGGVPFTAQIISGSPNAKGT